jgi:hypothetical protein
MKLKEDQANAEVVLLEGSYDETSAKNIQSPIPRAGFAMTLCGNP